MGEPGTPARYHAACEYRIVYHMHISVAAVLVA